MKRLLALSHAGALNVNRAPFQWLAREAEADVTLIVPRAWRGDLFADVRFEPSPDDRGIRVVPLKPVLSGNGSLYFYASALAGLGREIAPDHVFIDEEPWSLAALQAFRAFRGAPRSFFTKQNLRKRLPLPFRGIERAVFAESTHAFSVAQEVTDVLRWKGYGKPIIDLPHSYDPELFRPLAADERRKRRRELGLPEGALIVAYLGRLAEEKGIDDLIAAMREISSDPSLQHVFFWIVGNGPLAERARAAALELGPARAAAREAIPHHEVGRALACIDVLVLPSRTATNWKEQFGRILVEAQASGAAALGSSSGEIPRLLARTGGGLVFRERDPADLAAKIRELALDEPRLRELARAGRAYVEAKLTHRAVARQLARDLGFSLRSPENST